MSFRIAKSGFLSHQRQRILILAALTTIGTSPAHAQDAAAGAKVFQRCAGCHASTAAGSPKLGPNLFGIFGRRVATHPGYKYSAAMTEADFNWDAAHLDGFIARPQQVVKGTKMPFGGIADARERQSLIAYLRSLKGTAR